MSVSTSESETAQAWSQVVGQWIKEAERQMDEAHRIGDVQAYRVARHWLRDMKAVRAVLDPIVGARSRAEARRTTD